MNTSELMIGDWVKFNNSDLAHKVIAIAGKSIKVDKVYWYSANKFRPIPLTPEILEKNGWVKDLYSVESYDNEELECLSLWVGEDGKNKWWWRVGVELVTPINYVHEFQHALRLCGIEKEIIL